MFEKILIANRGEIACRVIRTCKRLGIKTVVVYSEADATSLAVRQADEAVCIGLAPSADSYLQIDKVIAAAKQTGAQAIHPGFGFLSENPAFATAIDEAGLVFIGPPVGAIKAMGDKIESKRVAREAGVSTVPGHMDLIADADEAVRIAEQIGFPVMIKASAGGGGKGMRVAFNVDEARDGYQSAQAEARSSFGDDRIFIEKFVEQPRHIEIQVMADKHGNCLYLGERECSIQRRHQKVVEEAPSPFLDEATRQAMGRQSVTLAKAVDYCSAGTVEFIVDKDRNFYFLEMNTRLQVEHPVTEEITGLDLVELMIKVAAGEHLPMSQDQVKLEGWAMECRVYAEDPLRNFMPSIGILTRCQEPEGEGIRVDTGVDEGSEISVYYDPMIAKLVTFGDDRTMAIERMRLALDSYLIEGIGHNVSFLRNIMDREAFTSGNLTTNFIAEEYPGGFSQESLEPSEPNLFRALAAFAAARHLQRSPHVHKHEPVELVSLLPKATREQATEGDDQQAEQKPIRVEDTRIILDGQTYQVSTDWQPGQLLLKGEVEGKPIAAQLKCALGGRDWQVSFGGQILEVKILPAHVAPYLQHMPVKAEADTSKVLLAPMPGMITAIHVEVGDTVKAGDPLLSIEAMKMENMLRAEKDVSIAAIEVSVGDSVDLDQVLLRFL